jgi:hypothetical protein
MMFSHENQLSVNFRKSFQVDSFRPKSIIDLTQQPFNVQNCKSQLKQISPQQSVTESE